MEQTTEKGAKGKARQLSHYTHKGKGGDSISIEEEILGAIINAEPEEMQPPWQINKRNYDAYEKALHILARLRAEGKVDFEYDRLSRAYESHSIFVTLKFDDDGFAKANDAREIAELLNHFEGFTVSIHDPEMWNLSIQIYVPKEIETP